MSARLELSFSIGPARCAWSAIAVSALITSGIAQVASESAPNPHWRPDGCGVCHSSEGPPAPIEPRAVTPLCLSCHDGKRAISDAHPVGRTPSEQTRIPPGWPLVEGRLSCTTCHDFSRHCAVPSARPARNPAFLRRASGVDGIALSREDGARRFSGTDAHRSAFCATCHIPALHERHNPHMMLSADQTPDAVRCGFCHVDPAAVVRAETRMEAQLHTDELTLCGGCHTSHVDFFTPGHMNATASPRVLEALRELDRRMNVVSVDGSPRFLPLDAAGAVTCSTCHNPHQRGVFQEHDIRATGAMSVGQSDARKFGLRLPSGQLCAACHPGVGGLRGHDPAPQPGAGRGVIGHD